MITAAELEKRIKERREVVLKNDALGIDTRRWVVEGDVGLREDQIAGYAAERVALAEAIAAGDNVKKEGLLAIESDGRILRWQRGRVLDYCVWRPSFTTAAEYHAVVEGMELATEDWMAICGVRFEYRADQDNNPDLALGDLLFPVLRSAGGGTTVAMAFFPNDPDSERIVWVFDGYFGGSGFDPVGVLRHELGHVLGFRHEHIRPEAPDIFDPESLDDTVDLTQYDPMSVMHYVAPGVGNPKLTFTDADRKGSKRVYGHPDRDFTFAPE